MAEAATVGGSGTLFVGEDKTFRLHVLDGPASNAGSLPININGWSILFDVRKKDASPEPPIFSKSASIIGVFNADRALNSQRAVVTLTDTELNTVVAKTYRHSWKRMDDGSETVLAWGNYIVQKATAP